MQTATRTIFIRETASQQLLHKYRLLLLSIKFHGDVTTADLLDFSTIEDELRSRGELN